MKTPVVLVAAALALATLFAISLLIVTETRGDDASLRGQPDYSATTTTRR